MPAFFSLTWLACRSGAGEPVEWCPWRILVLFALDGDSSSWPGSTSPRTSSKFAAVTAAGWWFLAFFEAVSWVLLVGAAHRPGGHLLGLPGPTKVIVEEQPQVFDALSIAFPLPGEHNSAQLGLPDVLFFALFLGDDRSSSRSGPS